MNIAKYSLDNPKVIYFFLAVMLIGGVLSFGSLGKKEDSPFVIKTAVLITQYPGASPKEVEELITEPIEREIQSMRRVYKIKSDSYYGMSKINIELSPATPPEEMPQMWDELRRKVLNVQSQLPQGASTIKVSDDFGDVFGIYFSLTADEGFTYRDLRDWGQRLKTELVTIEGVQKVALFGEQTEVVNVFISMSKLANSGINLNNLMQTIKAQNSLINTGEKRAGSIQLKILAEGTYKNLTDIKNQLISTETGQQVRLGDIAMIEKGYLEPPGTLIRVNGKKAIGIGVSTAPDYDVVKAGEAVRLKLARLEEQMPVGIEMVTLYPEDQIAREANNGFILNLIESVFIVILIILLVMGVRAGLLIGSSLVFCIGGTLLIMQFMGVGLNRTSLAAFIIAMGMLVDNAIVVTDNAQVAIQRGVRRRQALIDGATVPQWGLLGATMIAVFSFLPLYLAQSSVAEMVKPLFIVLAVSLLLSWVLALTQTTVFGNFILKQGNGEACADPYDKPFYHKFGRLLRFLIRYKVTTLVVMIGLFMLSLVVMGALPQNFFPNMDKPYFRADCFLPEGYSIRETERDMGQIEDFLMQQEEVVNVSGTYGSSPLRYYLASTSFGPKSNFGNLLVEVKDKKYTAAVESRLNEYVRENYPNILIRSSLFKLSPAVEANIEFGFIGDNIDTLTMLTEKAMAVMRKCDMVTDIKNSWGNKVPIWEPVYSQERGQRLGITRQAVAYALKIATNGLPIGDYREKDLFMPILLKEDNIASSDIDNMRTLPVFSQSGYAVPLAQVVDSFAFNYNYNVVKRYNREKVMMAQCDSKRGANTMAAFSQMKRMVQDEVAVPQGYRMKIFGEDETQEESNSAMAANLPLTFILMFVVLLFLFRTYRKPTIILLMVPLIFIGVVFGLAVTGKMLDFFAILGVLGLIGMNIKNAIVLVDQIGIEEAKGTPRLEAIIEATKSRIVPVSMASGTTILGMLPLLFDAMFGGMAACIMGGLLVASLLTIFVLPVTYSLLFRVKVTDRTEETIDE
ncbi:efflux RND transporter permease subunit [Odoribacter sp. Z80]|uniref:efflux RND transporter permease subunit n=1 Tax=Odoribacter sp. Z80 TaxID=2304575 RepID=UPI00137A494F|nr:efflux RND transporter permease subunit [Odoribacter sp. Z80]NCE73168.1 efflux RND transporter permease subunit [Odoribacter sp. Z80]